MSLFVVAIVCAYLCTWSAASARAAVAHPYFSGLAAETADGRQNAIAAPLPGGDVLIAGGADNLALRSAEIFDPATETFRAVAGLTRLKRTGAAAAPLLDGRVLIAGGGNEVGYVSAELFDPVSETFSDVAADMTTERNGGVAAPLPDGRVLIAGGRVEGLMGVETLDSAEVFDPATGSFTALGAHMARARSGAFAVPLASGKVLIGGGSGPRNPARGAEVFDPLTGAFSLLSAEPESYNDTAVAAALPDGNVLIAGGFDGSLPTRAAGLLDSGNGIYASLPATGDTQMTTERAYAVAAPLKDGRVLISGGSWPDARHSAELFVPAPALRASGGDLGTTAIGSTATATLTVRNAGAQSLRIDDHSLQGPEAGAFEIAGSCAGKTLLFEQSCALTVHFRPSSPGLATAELTFTDNEPTPSGVSLSGTGIEPPEDPGPQFPTPPGTGNPVPRPQPFSVPCRAKRLAGGKRAKVTCRFAPTAGASVARLERVGHPIASRHLAAGTQRVEFRVPFHKGGRYRLRVEFPG